MDTFSPVRTPVFVTSSLSSVPCDFFFAVQAPASLLSDSPPDSSQHWLRRRPFFVTADTRAPTCCLEPASRTLAGSTFFPFRPFLVTVDAPDPTPVLEPASAANPSWIAALPRRPVLVTVDVDAHALTCIGAGQPREPLLDFLFSFLFFCWTACLSPNPCGQFFTRLAMTRVASSLPHLRTDLHPIGPIFRSVGFTLDSSSPDSGFPNYTS